MTGLDSGAVDHECAWNLGQRRWLERRLLKTERTRVRELCFGRKFGNHGEAVVVENDVAALRIGVRLGRTRAGKPMPLRLPQILSRLSRFLGRRRKKAYGETGPGAARSVTGSISCRTSSTTSLPFFLSGSC
jgi:hypothetical protein